MTAPERIWVDPDLNDHHNPATEDWTGGSWRLGHPCFISTEYVRADLYATLAAEKEAVERERDALKAAKWDVKHTDTMNEIVQMGMARDEERGRAARMEEALDHLQEMTMRGEPHNRLALAVQNIRAMFARAALTDTPREGETREGEV